MKYYQTVEASVDCCDEWIYYSGYNLDAAKKQCESVNRHADKTHRAEIRVYVLKKPFEALSDDEQSDALSCYDIIDY